MSIFARTTPPQNAQRVCTYRARLAHSNPDSMELGWRTEAGMRYLRELAARPQSSKTLAAALAATRSHPLVSA